MMENSKEQVLSKTVQTRKSPESVFVEIPHSAKLELLNKNSLTIFHLNVLNNKFSYTELFDLLKDNLGTYVLSRREYNENPLRAISKAISKLRDIEDNGDKGAGGELGELLLYLFLEHYLGAPKLLSKVELKTTANQYVFNADGIHFFNFNEDGNTNYQVLVCESKLNSKLEKAIDAAFGSIKSSKANSQFEIQLVNAELFKETFSTQDAQIIKSMIIPNASDDNKNNIYKNHAFAIFIGSDYKIDATQDIYTQRKLVGDDLLKRADDIANIINVNIKKHNLSGYSFYVYYLPFNDVAKDRKEIMSQLLTEDYFSEV